MCGGGWGSAPDWRSLSARRAWIEIKYKRDQTILKVVALRKESVDRNIWLKGEIYMDGYVALRKESVDRNAASGCAPSANGAGRSPQGERG